MIDVDISSVISANKSQPKKMLQHWVEDGCDYMEVNNSSLSTMKTCWRKADYMLERGLSHRQSSAATTYGQAVHACNEYGLMFPVKERVVTEECESNILEMHLFGNNHKGCVICDSIEEGLKVLEPLRVLDEWDKRSLKSFCWTMLHYWKRYAEDPFKVYADNEGLMIERNLKTLIVNKPKLKIWFVGTIDVVLENITTGDILICDHKTTSVLGNDFYNRINPNDQYTGYIMLAQRELGLNTDRFLVNGIQVKAVPKTTRGTIPNYVRQITSRSKEDIDELIKTVEYYCTQYLELKKNNFWPTGDVSPCSSYGGCQYLDICSVPDNVKESIIKNTYETGAFE